MAPSKTDPRDESLAVSFTLPKSWSEQTDSSASSAMLLAGVAMLTRNPVFVWPSLFIAVSSYINQTPLRTKEGGMGSVAVLSALGCLVTVNIPRVIIQEVVPVAAAVPVSTPLFT